MTRRLLVALDPGVRKAGVAVFDADTGVLLWAGTISTRSTAKTVTRIIEQVESLGSVVRVVTELMQKRASQRSKHKDLDRVTAATDLLEKRSGWKVTRRAPSKWKRNVPKPVCKARALDILQDDEAAVLVGDGHDMYDAIGIGLVELGRAKPGVIPLS